MKKLIAVAAALLVSMAVFSQNTLSLIVADSLSKEAILGAVVQVEGSAPTTGGVTDASGFLELKNLPSGKTILAIRFVGFSEKRVVVELPRAAAPLQIFLSENTAELQTTIITSTRTNSRIEDIATKVEVLGTDDVESENSLKPSNIASLLGDLSVIHIQQTSATTGASSVRMQGLDGKYTQILRDGLPLYEGFSGSFGVLQIPPLDLRQIELIKGSNSTLHGGGAIGGLINLVSKEPAAEPEASLTLNGSTLKEGNINGFFAKKMGKIGLSMFVGNTFQRAVDVNADGFSDVPSVVSSNLHPRFFYYLNEKTTLKIGLSSVTETRAGGDMTAIESKPTAAHPFFENEKTSRNSLDFQWNSSFSGHQLTAKGVFGIFKRSSEQSGFLFQGRQKSGFAELSDFFKKGKHDLVFGANFIGDGFKKLASDSTAIGDFANTTLGVFAQDGWQISPRFLMETGLRGDFLNQKTATAASKSTPFLLPRLAFLFRARPNLTLRLSGSTGYQAANIFNQESLAGGFDLLKPLPPSIRAERSLSANGDLNFHTILGEKLSLTFNQAFYFTAISDPIFLENGLLKNSVEKTRAIGSDSYFRFVFSPFEAYFGYNHTISRLGSQPVLFAPNDKIGFTLASELNKKWTLGLESSWVGNQFISLTKKAGNYWFWAAAVEWKMTEQAMLVLNVENLFDARQSRRGPLFSGDVRSPVFSEIYMPIDGRVANLSIRLKL